MTSDQQTYGESSTDRFAPFVETAYWENREILGSVAHHIMRMINSLSDRELLQIATRRETKRLHELKNVGPARAALIMSVLQDALALYSDPNAMPELGPETEGVLPAMDAARDKAIDSLARYKFVMFGYHAGTWVNYNKLLPKGQRQENPFREFVKLAREIRAGGAQ